MSYEVELAESENGLLGGLDWLGAVKLTAAQKAADAAKKKEDAAIKAATLAANKANQAVLRYGEGSKQAVAAQNVATKAATKVTTVQTKDASALVTAQQKDTLAQQKAAHTAQEKILAPIRVEIKKVTGYLPAIQDGVKSQYIGQDVLDAYNQYLKCLNDGWNTIQGGGQYAPCTLSAPAFEAVKASIAAAKKKAEAAAKQAKTDAATQAKIDKTAAKTGSKASPAAQDQIKKAIDDYKKTLQTKIDAAKKQLADAKAKKAAAQKPAAALKGLFGFDGLLFLGEDVIDPTTGEVMQNAYASPGTTTPATGVAPVSSVLPAGGTDMSMIMMMMQQNATPQPAKCAKHPTKPECLFWQLSNDNKQTMMIVLTMISDMENQLTALMQQLAQVQADAANNQVLQGPAGSLACDATGRQYDTVTGQYTGQSCGTSGTPQYDPSTGQYINSGIDPMTGQPYQYAQPGTYTQPSPTGGPALDNTPMSMPGDENGSGDIGMPSDFTPYGGGAAQPQYAQPQYEQPQYIPSLDMQPQQQVQQVMPQQTQALVQQGPVAQAFPQYEPEGLPADYAESDYGTEQFIPQAQIEGEAVFADEGPQEVGVEEGVFAEVGAGEDEFGLSGLGWGLKGVRFLG